MKYTRRGTRIASEDDVSEHATDQGCGKADNCILAANDYPFSYQCVKLLHMLSTEAISPRRFSQIHHAFPTHFRVRTCGRMGKSKRLRVLPPRPCVRAA